MGEALLTKYGGKAIGEGYTLKTAIFTNNDYFSVPEAKDQKFAVRIFGGGGGWSSGGGGGGGNMNNAVLILNIGDAIPIIIGAGGKNGWSTSRGNNGGTTSFGTYLSATGGEAGGYSNGTMHKGGGNGGTGGGSTCQAKGGDGTYGGGGGGGIVIFNIANNYWGDDISGGNGGIYGGGGGCGWTGNSSVRDYMYLFKQNGGISLGGWGNGGNNTTVATNGLDTTKMYDLEFVGKGIAGFNGYRDGGGGYGGCGGKSYYVLENDTWSPPLYRNGGGGGGGGYGANGANGYRGYGGGGGGYGHSPNGAGGGGYGPEGYGHGGDGWMDDDYAKSGICIISYLEPLKTKLI